MPLYEYECGTCGVFTALKKMSESNAPAQCEQCGCESERIISAPHLAILGKQQRAAHELNEKSANEPRVARRSSCGCTGKHTCKTTADKAKAGNSKKAAGNASGLQMQTKKTARPWMLGH